MNEISKETLDKWLDQIDDETLQMDVSMDSYLRGFRSGAAHVIDFLTDKIKEEQEAKR